MSDILAKICNDKLNHIKICKSAISIDEMKDKAANAPKARGFINALRDKINKGQYGLIAEIKKASPSKGLIRKNFAPASLARDYQAGGAACLSVLTDKPYFQGNNDYLTAARMAVDLPVLRKDFMLDIYQIYEAKAIGADCILLIMAALGDIQATELEDIALKLGMDILIETHNMGEMERALMLKSPLIGINNSNLKTLKIDLTVTEELANMVDDNHILISESGIYSPSDLRRMNAAGAN